jgi:uroporphyrin-III C-methyltransferase/precorrin-2 dehydrogenase/sirohydrochlorin ferrochelatase
MAPLARLPVFLSMAGRRALIVGGNQAAAWKAELLSAAGATVEVHAEKASEELLAIAADAPGGAISIHRRAPRPADCAGAALAIGAIEDDTEAARFSAAMREAGIPVNVIDKPQLSDFTFGAIVNRSPLVIGISTDGAAPIFAQAIRSRIERLIPRGFAAWAEAARSFRPRLASFGLAAAERRRFWEKFVDRAVARPDDRPGDADLQALIAPSGDDTDRARAGSVVLVDAGTRDSDLLTLRALRALQSADVIVIDRDVAPDVLDLARREAKKLMLGPTTSAAEITALILTFARAGRRVVRLAGDSRGASGELAACRAAGIAVETVPAVGTEIPENGGSNPQGPGDERTMMPAE